MKIAFSTLGCPGWSWEDMIVTAKDLGFDGIEVRGIENEMYVPKAKPFIDSQISATKRRIAHLGLEIPCLTSSCYLFDKSNIDYYVNEGKEYIELAFKLGVPFIRVLGDRNPEPGENIDMDLVASSLAVLAEYGLSKGIKVLVETNGVFADSNKMAKLLKKADHPGVGVLWDVHHPYRFIQEPVVDTYNNLKDFIKFVHIKDSIMENGQVKYKMVGYGDIPVNEVLQLLKKDGYNGFVSLEWVKRWCMDLEEPGVVFSHFINFVNTAIAG